MTNATLSVLGGFHLAVDGASVPLDRPGARLVAFLALRRSAQPPTAVVDAVWPGVATERGLRSLDSLLEVLPDAVTERLVVDADTGRLALDRRWTIDLDDALAAARRLHVDPRPVDGDLATFRLDLLPDWFESWLVDLQEQYHRLRRSALARLGRHQLTAGAYDDVVDIALELLSEDVLREDAQHLLIAGLVERGDLTVARRAFDRFRARLRHEMGTEPTPQLAELVGATVGGTSLA